MKSSLRMLPATCSPTRDSSARYPKVSSPCTQRVRPGGSPRNPLAPQGASTHLQAVDGKQAQGWLLYLPQVATDLAAGTAGNNVHQLAQQHWDADIEQGSTQCQLRGQRESCHGMGMVPTVAQGWQVSCHGIGMAQRQVTQHSMGTTSTTAQK